MFYQFKAERDAGSCPATNLKEEKNRNKQPAIAAKKEAYSVADMMGYYS